MHTAGKNISILLVDGEPLISLDLSETLENAGYEVIGPAATVAAAPLLLDRRTPQYAVIDVKLRNKLCLDLVRQLRRRNVPFIVHKGYPKIDGEVAEVGEAPRLLKPASPSDLLTAVIDLLAAPRRDGTPSNQFDGIALSPVLVPGSIR